MERFEDGAEGQKKVGTTGVELKKTRSTRGKKLRGSSEDKPGSQKREELGDELRNINEVTHAIRGTLYSGKCHSVF